MSFSISQTSLSGFQFDMTAWVKVNLYWILRRLLKPDCILQRGTREEVGIITDFTDPRS